MQLAPCLVASLAIASAAGCQPRSLPTRIAQAYGVARFGEIEALRYTWNVQVPGRSVSRRWQWVPRSDRVTRHHVIVDGKRRPGPPITYHRREIGPAPGAGNGAPTARSAELRRIDGQFINDRYWLLYPFHLVWDRAAGAHIATHGRRVVVTYPGRGGYTPGNVYEVFAGPNDRLTRWIFRRRPGGKPVPASWSGHRRLGPIIVSTEHRDRNRRFRLWFTDVAVKVAGRWQGLGKPVD